MIDHLPIGPMLLGVMTLFADASSTTSITDRSVEWPTWENWMRVLLLRDYNTRVVVLGTTLLGLAAGVIGSFTLLRKRALMGDALSHATLPGIGLAFMIATSLGYDGKSLWTLLSGGAVTGVIGILSILWIRNLTRLKEDAALGIVLGVFFGGGIAVLGIIQQMPEGHAAGLESFIYGKTASMTTGDAWMIGVAGLTTTLVCVLFFKELKLLCFDEGFAGSRGFPVVRLDLLLMALVTIVTIVGLQAVGLILMIALLVIPAAAARFWTDRMTSMMFFSAWIGAFSCMIGASLSAIFPRLPSGAMIVISSATVFIFSMMLGPKRGVLIRRYRRQMLNRKIDRQHLLRGLYELIEQRPNSNEKVDANVPVSWDQLLQIRSWKPQRLTRCIRRARQEQLVHQETQSSVSLTPAGLEVATRLVHDHRLWEIYLITYADVAASRVDRDADRIEHVLDAEIIDQLEDLLEHRRDVHGVPNSPHVDPLSGNLATEPRNGNR